MPKNSHFLTVVDGNAPAHSRPTRAAIEQIQPRMHELGIPEPQKWSARNFQEIQATISMWSMLQQAEHEAAENPTIEKRASLVGID